MTTTDADEDQGAHPSGGRRARRHRHRRVAQGIAVAAALGGALAGARPTGTAVVDPLLTAGFAALVTLAASRGRRWPLLALPAGALVLASGWLFVPALGSALAAVGSASRRRRHRVWGAATAALALQAMLRAPELGFHGLPSLVVAAAVLPPLWSGYRMCRSAERRRIRAVAAVAGGAVAVVGLAYGALVLTVAGDIDRATGDARAGLEATRQGDTDAARGSFARASSSFERTDRLLNSWWATPARAVPVLSQHARALGGAASEGRQMARTAGETVEAADYQQLRYTSGRFDLNRIRSVREPLDRTIASMRSARGSLAADASPWLAPPLAEGLDRLDRELADAQAEADLAARAIDVAPALLGAEGPRRYFIAFVTPAEVRGSGGFMGSWAEITASDGELRLTRSGAVQELFSELPEAGIEIDGPPDYLARWGRFVGGAEFIGDFGYSPHFPFSAEVMAQIYPQTGGAEVDGVISIDPIALAALLEFTGPVEVGGFGTTLDPTNAARFLLEDNYALFPDDRAQNEALAELVELTFEDLTTGSLPSPRAISEVLAEPTRAGRIRLWSPRDDEQALFAALGADGAFAPPADDRDFLAVSSQNSGNNKIDVYMERDVDYDVEIAGGGELRATVTVTIRNDPPLDGSVPEYVIGNRQGDPLGTNRMFFSVHTPHELEGATVDGAAVGVEPQQEAGYNVYSRIISVPPGGEVVVEMRLRGTLDATGGYHLDLAPHPVATPDRLTVDLTRTGGAPVVVGPEALAGARELSLGASG